jgi:hypothetical protein
MRLPPALSPWAPWLAVFPEPAALALGSWIARLAPALGALRRVSRLQPGEPDGYRGLSRRGPYERLVAGEWALAEAVPEEFLRRAAHREQLFLELSTAEPAGALRSIALFDAGPGQLGAPRLAHLAALIALAQRAETAGASFAWGLLQRPAEELCEGVTPETLARLLQGRSALEPGDTDLQAWNERLGPATESDDRWTIGSRGLRGRMAPGFCLGSLEVLDPYEPERPVLLAVVRRGQEPAREIELELPDPRSCAQLLRDPFRLAGVAPQVAGGRVAVASNLLFAGHETRLLARLDPASGNGLIAYSVPRSPRDRPGKPRLLLAPNTETITAAGWFRRRFVAVASTAQELILYGVGVQGTQARVLSRLPRESAPDFVPAGPDAPLQPCFYRPGDAPGGLLYFVDGAGQLFRASPSPGTPAQRLAERVLTVAPTARQDVRFYYATLGSGAAAGPVNRVSFCSSPQGKVVAEASVDPDAGAAVRFGCRATDGLGRPSLAALRLSRTSCLILDLMQDRGSFAEIRVADGAEVLGVWMPVPGAQGPVLVVLEPGRRALSLHTESDSRMLIRSTDEIPAACVGAGSGLIGYRTPDGEIAVRSIESGAVLLRVVPEAEP